MDVERIMLANKKATEEYIKTLGIYKSKNIENLKEKSTGKIIPFVKRIK